VPALRTDGRTITENPAIHTYLARRNPEARRPRPPRRRSHVPPRSRYPVGLVLRSSFWLGGGTEPSAAARGDETGLQLMQHANTEWKLPARFLPSLYAAEAEGSGTPIPW
jgi:glutathione S-transferase